MRKSGKREEDKFKKGYRQQIYVIIRLMLRVFAQGEQGWKDRGRNKEGHKA